jgi:CheY-like chemotaxis protein
VNLLLNAAHALEDKGDGRIVLRSSVTTEHVIVTVEDDGRGIPGETLDVIFEPFFTTRAGKGGTGLGLSICRDIVVRAGGNLLAKSTVGKGTTMEVTLARYRGDGVGREVPGPPRLPAEVRPSATRRRVLVIDDEPAIVRTLCRSLAPHAEVTGEADPARALERILQAGTQLDVILCDVMMPGLTGIDLHERVARERPELAGCFVFITGGTYTARTRDYLARVPNLCLDKPVDVAQVLAAIERVAGESESRAT